MSEGIVGVLVATLLNGLRHGFDVDHVAAITDITALQHDRRRALTLGTLYALGHALVVAVLGAAAVLAGARIPRGLDPALERVVGATLVALALYVAYSLIRYGSEARIQSRWVLLARGTRRVAGWLGRVLQHRQEIVIRHEHAHAHDRSHEHHHPPAADRERERGAVAVATKHRHTHEHVVTGAPDLLAGYGARSSFAIGVIHGIGAETPTQLLLFLTAAGIATTGVGLAVVGVFVVGLLITNTALVVASTWGSVGGRDVPIVYVAFAIISAAFSGAVGVTYLLGRADTFAGLLGG